MFGAGLALSSGLELCRCLQVLCVHLSLGPVSFGTLCTIALLFEPHQQFCFVLFCFCFVLFCVGLLWDHKPWLTGLAQVVSQ